MKEFRYKVMDEMISKEIGRRLRNLREDKGLKQEELGAIMGRAGRTISNQYDPQIAALQTEIDKYIAEGAADKSDEIKQLQVTIASEQSGHDAYIYWYSTTTDHTQYDPTIHQQYELYNFNSDLLVKYKQLESDYQKEQSDQSQLTTMQSQKKFMVDIENESHQQRLIDIYQIYT